MKKLLLSLSLLAFVGSISVFSSCDKIKDKVKEEAGVDLDFDLDGASANFTLPILTNTNTQSVVDTVEVPFDINAEISSNTGGLYSIDDIESITITSVSMKINDGNTNNNFANLKTAMVAFYTDTKSDVAWIATNDAVPDVEDYEIDLVPSESNLAEYLKGSKVFYMAGVNPRRATNKELSCTMNIKWHIKLKEK
jgi:uncharacterized protein YceK